MRMIGSIGVTRKLYHFVQGVGKRWSSWKMEDKMTEQEIIDVTKGNMGMKVL